MRVTGADIMVVIHFECWEHFTEHQAELLDVFKEEDISERVHWLTPGEATHIV